MEEIYDFGMILQKLRKERGWTQDYLASRINKESSIISRYENNLQSPTFDTVRSFAAIFNVSMDYLSGMEQHSNISTVGLYESQRVLLQNLADEFRANNNTAKKMTDEQCKLIGRIVEEFVK
ncbi:MAG: helix-turn-helix transcriptional regulator [Oscillospiraceae bacterium]|nr:helix-turn-helix transcriptional regulator [Oscillospiraceae bacterium]